MVSDFGLSLLFESAALTKIRFLPLWSLTFINVNAPSESAVVVPALGPLTKSVTVAPGSDTPSIVVLSVFVASGNFENSGAVGAIESTCSGSLRFMENRPKSEPIFGAKNFKPAKMTKRITRMAKTRWYNFLYSTSSVFVLYLRTCLF